MRIPLCLILTAVAASATSLETIQLDSGPVRGQASATGWSYKNLPFAAPPVGDLRWRAPQPVAPWSEVRDATAWGPVCPQFEGNSPSGAVIGAEDCLQLNVWVPASKVSSQVPLPVMVWIPGGGNLVGGASEQKAGVYTYDAAALTAKANAVVITVNYRLGPLGFLAHPEFRAESDPSTTGNYGILDLVAALQWVGRNAAAFGGDTGRVTILGESAGALNTCTLLASPLAAGLFQGAIIESGGCSASPMAVAESFGKTVFAAAECSDAQCMRDLSAEAVLRAKPQVVDVGGIGSSSYGAVVDDYLLKQGPLATIQAGAHNAVPVIIGNNTDETSRSVPNITTVAQYQAAIQAMFPVPSLSAAVLKLYPASDYVSPHAALVAVTTDAKFACLGADASAHALRDAQSAPVFRYVFSHGLENGGAALKAQGAWHGLDVPFVFGDLAVGGYRPSAAELTLSSNFQRYWGNFAATGNPNGGLFTWPVFDQREQYLDLDDTLSVAAQYRKKYCTFWESLGRLGN